MWHQRMTATEHPYFSSIQSPRMWTLKKNFNISYNQCRNISKNKTLDSIILVQNFLKARRFHYLFLFNPIVRNCKFPLHDNYDINHNCLRSANSDKILDNPLCDDVNSKKIFWLSIQYMNAIEYVFDFSIATRLSLLLMAFLISMWKLFAGDDSRTTNNDWNNFKRFLFHWNNNAKLDQKICEF